MISSTPKVAMPAARPERRISGSPTRAAKVAPTAAAASSETTFPDSRSASHGKRLGRSALFSSAGIVSTPAVHAPTATNATWPNETTPELPTKR